MFFRIAKKFVFSFLRYPLSRGRDFGTSSFSGRLENSLVFLQIQKRDRIAETRERVLGDVRYVVALQVQMSEPVQAPERFTRDRVQVVVAQSQVLEIFCDKTKSHACLVRTRVGRATRSEDIRLITRFQTFNYFIVRFVKFVCFLSRYCCVETKRKHLTAENTRRSVRFTRTVPTIVAARYVFTSCRSRRLQLSVMNKKRTRGEEKGVFVIPVAEYLRRSWTNNISATVGFQTF